MSKTLIREASIDDIDKGLLDVFIEGYRFHQNGRPDVFTIENDGELKEVLLSSFEKTKLIVITDNDNKEILGYMSYLIKNKNGNKKLDVDELVIKEGYRGKGLGRKLMDESKKIALDNDCNRIELNCWMFNESAMSMYEHIGFNKQRIMYEMLLK